MFQINLPEGRFSRSRAWFAFLPKRHAVLFESVLGPQDLILTARVTLISYFLMTFQSLEIASWKWFDMSLKPPASLWESDPLSVAVC